MCGLALQAVREGLHGPGIFAAAGDMDKAVDQLDRNLPGCYQGKFNHIKEVALGQVVGPLQRAPLSASRILP